MLRLEKREQPGRRTRVMKIFSCVFVSLATLALFSVACAEFIEVQSGVGTETRSYYGFQASRDGDFAVVSARYVEKRAFRAPT